MKSDRELLRWIIELSLLSYHCQVLACPAEVLPHLYLLRAERVEAAALRGDAERSGAVSEDWALRRPLLFASCCSCGVDAGGRTTISEDSWGNNSFQPSPPFRWESWTSLERGQNRVGKKSI